jgi:hypothetical protein
MDGILLGGAILVGGVLVHIWASGYLTKEMALTTAGPYSMVRNPFYISTLAVDCGLACMFSNPWVFLGYGVIAYLYVYRRRIGVEESVLVGKFGDEFRGYCNLVPRIIPWGCLKGGKGTFGMANLKRHHELSRGLNHIALAAAALSLSFIYSGLTFMIALPVSIYILSTLLRRFCGI